MTDVIKSLKITFIYNSTGPFGEQITNNDHLTCHPEGVRTTEGPLDIRECSRDSFPTESGLRRFLRMTVRYCVLYDTWYVLRAIHPSQIINHRTDFAIAYFFAKRCFKRR